MQKELSAAAQRAGCPAHFITLDFNTLNKVCKGLWGFFYVQKYRNSKIPTVLYSICFANKAIFGSLTKNEMLSAGLFLKRFV